MLNSDLEPFGIYISNANYYEKFKNNQNLDISNLKFEKARSTIKPDESEKNFQMSLKQL